MIKKLAVATVVLLVLAFAGFYIVKRGLGPRDPAEFLPEGTLFYVTMGNLPRTALRWQETALAKIGAEPDVAEALRKPLASLMATLGVPEIDGMVRSLKPTSAFFAATGFSATDATMAVGIQYVGGRGAFDEAVARLRKELPPSQVESLSHGGTEILASKHGKVSLFTASVGIWGFLSSDRALMETLIERASGKGTGPSLAQNPNYQSVLSNLMPDADCTVFLDWQKALDGLLEIGRTLGERPIPGQVAKLRMAKAVGASFQFDGELQRDTLFILAPGGTPPPKLSKKALALADSRTAFFAEFRSDFRGFQELMGGKKLPPSLQELIEKADASFGPGCAIMGIWPETRKIPAAIAAIEVRDRQNAQQVVQTVCAMIPGTSMETRGGRDIYSFPALGNPFSLPSLALMDETLLIGIDAEAVVHVAGAGQPGSPGLAQSPAFRAAMPAYESANEMFAYLDARTLFERSYNELRPWLILSAAFVPGMSKYIGPKLPETETISRHLSPIILSQNRTPEGIRFDSSGPITMTQAAVVGAAAVMSTTKSFGLR